MGKVIGLLGDFSSPLVLIVAGVVVAALVVYVIRELSARRKHLNDRQRQRREFWGYE